MLISKMTEEGLEAIRGALWAPSQIPSHCTERQSREEQLPVAVTSCSSATGSLVCQAPFWVPGLQ